jgi:very-short-patch-repair endonuclease
MQTQDDFNQLSLKRSIHKVGQLYPILENQKGEILDGNHRIQDNPKGERKTIQTQNRYEDLMIRGNAHYRRRVPQEETKQLILEMVQEAEKLGTSKLEVSKKLIEDLPYSEGYILSLLPSEFKETAKVEAGKSAHISEQTVTIQDMIECSNCHMGKHPNEIKQIDGKPYCLKCAPFIKARPAENIPNGVRLEKPTETWAYRKAVMTPQHSKMEEAILQKLDEAGIRPVVTDRSFCLASTTPDFYFPTLNLAVYLDGPVHEGKEDRDEELADLLEKRHQVRVCRIKYSGVTDKEQTRVLQEIKERTKT